MRASVNREVKIGAARPVHAGAKRSWVAILSLAAVLSASVSARALDSTNSASAPPKISQRTFSSAKEALRTGVDALQNGDAQSSVQALTYAAEGGEALARWKLGSMYATGDVVQRDDVKAFKYFEQLVDSYNEDDVDRHDLAAVARAFVAIGLYSLSGIPNSEIKADPERALEMFQVAATTFGDTEAQYRLARMYIDGAGGLAKDKMQAARWLAHAADKGHHSAQALLGHMLFVGDGVPRQSARGLMYLTMAHFSPKTPKEGWIDELHAKDFAAASEDDREAANLFLNAKGKREFATAATAAKPVAAPPAAAPMKLNGAASE